VADGDPVTHDDGIEIALAVEDGAILDVGVGADADGVDVTPQNGVHPNRGALAEYDVAEDLRGGVDVATAWNPGRVALVASEHGYPLQKSLVAAGQVYGGFGADFALRDEKGRNRERQNARGNP
jgi:hypothetical protein